MTPVEVKPGAGRQPRSFARRWSYRLGLGSVLLALAAGALIAWLVGTDAGRDTLLGRVVGMLPADSLRWERAEGTVRGPLVFHGLRYEHGGVLFTAERVLLDPDLLPVLGRRLQLDRLEIEGAVLTLPPGSDGAFELPTWPGSLPRLPMPLDIRSTVLVVDGLRVQRPDQPLIDIRRIDATGLHLVDEGLRISSLALDSDRGRLTLQGEYLPARDFLMDMQGTLEMPATGTAPAASLRFAAKGDLDALAISAAGRAPEPLSLDLDLRGPADAPTWTLDARSEGLDPGLWGGEPGAAWRFVFDAEGRGGDAELSGELARGDWRVGVEPSTLRLQQQRLEFAPLQLALAQGPLSITGQLRLDGEQSDFEAVLTSTGLRFEPASAEPDAMPVTAAGELRAAGRFDAWTLAGEATLERAGESARLELAGRGYADQLTLDQLHAATPNGRLDGSGQFRWSPALAFSLEAAMAGFDPGYFLPDYPGALSGQLQVRAEQDAAGAWRGDGELQQLSGQLRGRPVSGRIAADWNGSAGNGDAALRIGRSVIDVRGGFGARYDLRASFAPLALADLFADGEGELQGTLSVRGIAAAPDFAAELQGSSLRWGGHRADQLRVSGSLPATGRVGDFSLAGEGVVLAGVALDTLALRGSGSLAALRYQLDAAGVHGSLAAAGTLARADQQWRGRLEQLRIAADRAPVLTLENAADFAFGPDVLGIDRSCLVAASVSGRLCIAASRSEITVEGDALPLALAQPWLAPGGTLALAVEGSLDLRANLRRGRDQRWSGDASVVSARGAVRLDQDLEREIFGYRDLRLQLRLDGEALEGDLAATLADEGSVSARLRTGLAETAAMEGEIQLDVRRLTWLELFSEDIAGPTGRLQGRMVLAGTRGAPALSGQARLQAFTAELPAMGLKLAEGEFTLVGEADGSARVEGSVLSGEGRLRLDGSLNFRDATAPLRLALRGEQVTLASTPELYVVGNPDLTLRWLEDRLEVRGSLVVPEARIDLEALDSTVSVSPDVVVVDPLDGPRERAKPLDLDFSVSLGDEVKLKGFGLDGAMTGQLALRERPGRRATASGTLNVSGSYRAYGQALRIQRARLGFADSAYDNPTLDIRADRRFDQVVVGVQVRGTARRPETTVVSIPAMETSEALSWLVFGRPLSRTSGNESQQLGAAALALGAGGNLVAQQLGASLGLDEAGVTDSRNLGGATFTIGKYVSPRLFLSYGVSLVGAGQVVTLKYLLTRGFDISIESGNESAASLNWRIEK